MARATSFNYEIEMADGRVIHPLKIAEFSEGEEGRIDVADGSRKYKVRDQIFDIGEIEITILVTKDRYEYEIMQQWVTSGLIQDVYIIGRDASGIARLTWLLTNCDTAMGKKNEFDRNSKAVDTKKYFLLPEYVEEIVSVVP